MWTTVWATYTIVVYLCLQIIAIASMPSSSSASIYQFYSDAASGWIRDLDGR